MVLEAEIGRGGQEILPWTRELVMAMVAKGGEHGCNGSILWAGKKLGGRGGARSTREGSRASFIAHQW